MKDRLYDLIALLCSQFLQRRSSKMLKRRDSPMVVYANDYIGNEISANGFFEYEELECVKNFFNKIGINTFEGIFLDIGANIGNHSIYFSKYFTEVHSFEVSEQTRRLLQINASYFKNIYVHNYGLGDFDGFVDLRENPTNSGGTSIVKKNTTGGFEVRRLDNINFNYKKISLIKMDVEGYEMNVINGGMNLFLKHRPIILYELHSADFKNGKPEINSWLQKNNYDIYVKPYESKFIGRLSKILNIITGFTRKVKSVRDMEPGFYSMVIAMPNKI